jgi:hypothetical protein
MIYETFEIGTRVFYIEKNHGSYNVRYVGFSGVSAPVYLGRRLDSPDECRRLILAFLEEKTKTQINFLPKMVRDFISSKKAAASLA